MENNRNKEKRRNRKELQIYSNDYYYHRLIILRAFVSRVDFISITAPLNSREAFSS